jgi:hypothetical protein
MPKVAQICVFALLIPVKLGETGSHLTASATIPSRKYPRLSPDSGRVFLKPGLVRSDRVDSSVAGSELHDMTGDGKVRLLVQD